jgi:hypothetical protein
MKVKMTVDRKEGGYVILVPEDNPDEDILIPLRFLRDVEEGDIIEISFHKDEKAGREARERVEDLIVLLKNR